MLHFALRMVRYRVATAVAVACAVLGGAALLTAVGVLAESGLRSHLPAGRLGGADVVVTAEQVFRPDGDLPLALPERARVPADLADRVARLPGVATAVGDLSFPAAPLDGRGRLVPGADPSADGHGWSSVALLDGARVEGEPPSGAREVALGDASARAAGAGPGDRVVLSAAGRSASYRVSAVVAGADSGLFFADGTASGLAARQGVPRDVVDLVAVRAAPGAAADVAAEVAELARAEGLVTATGAELGDTGAPEAAAARYLLPVLAASLAGITVLVVGFVTAGGLAVSTEAQRRELALMRAVGATPRQIRRLAAGQASLVAGAAALPGLALGYPLAEQFRRLLVAAGMLPEALPLTMGPLPALAALLLLAAVVQSAARGASWRVSRLPATEAVAESHSEPRTPSSRRTLAGMLLLAAAPVASVAPLADRSEQGAAATAVAGVLAAIGLGLAGPALIGRLSGFAARRLPAPRSAPGWLALRNSHGYALRTAGAVSALAMVVVFTLTYTLARTTTVQATADELHDGTRAQLALSAPGLGGISEELLAPVRSVPGVRAASPVSTMTVLWQHRVLGETQVGSGPALVLDASAPAVLDPDVREGSLAELTGRSVALDAGTAASLGAPVGGTVELVLGDGARVEARVAATYARGLGFGPVVVSRELADGHRTSGLAERVLVRTDGSGTARRGLEELAASRPGLVVEDGGAAAGDDGPGAVPPELWINLAVLAVLLGYLVLGTANKLVAATARRRDEIAALRLIGALPAQIRAMMRREAALLCGAALGSGVLLSVLPLVFVGLGFLHRPWPAGPLWLLPALASVVAAVTFAAVELPVRRALRTPPGAGLGG